MPVKTPQHELRVAFVASFLHLGGTTTYLINLAGELRRRGVAVQVHSFERDNPLASDFQACGIEPRVQDHQRLIYEDRLCNILHALREFSPHAVVGWEGPAAYEVLRYVPAGTRRVACIHGDQPRLDVELARFASVTDHVVAVSAAVGTRLQCSGRFNSGQVKYIASGVVIPSPPPARDWRATRPLRVLYLGRLHQMHKRVRLLPTIYHQLITENVPVEWTIAGDGPERGFLEEQMISCPPAVQVHFHGQLPHARVGELLSQQDILLLPSDSEGMPLSLLEAMAYGLVPVVSDLSSGIREVVDTTTGRLVPLSDLAGYAQAIAWLHHHRAEAAEMSRAAAERIRQRFSIPAMANHWLQILQPPTAAAPVWPARVRILPRLIHHRRWDFYEPFRTVRRLLKRLQAL